MNETQEKQGGMPVWVMVVLIAVMVAVVLLLFSFIDSLMPTLEQPGVEVTLTTGQNESVTGRMLLTTQAELSEGVAQTWAEGCESSEGYHWLTESTDGGWSLYLWLPLVGNSVDYADLDLGAAVVGEQWTAVLNLPEGELSQTAEDSPIIQIVCTKGSAPNRVQVYQGGQPLDCESICVSASGQIYQAG